MPTLIDSLIVSLGIDPKGMDSKARAATQKLRELEQQSQKTEDSVKKIGETSKKTSEGFESVTKTVGSFLAILGGTLALKRFALDTIESNAALDRLSKNLGISVETISSWGNATESLGGSSQALQGTFDMLSKAQTELRLTGQSSLIPYLSALGVSLADAGGQARSVDDILLDLADRFSRMDRTTANNMGRMMGIDQGTLNLLLQGRREVELTIKRQKEYNAVTKAQAEEASKLKRGLTDVRQEFTALGRDLLQQASPALEKVLGLVSSFFRWLQENKEFVSDFGEILGVVAAGFAAIALAASPISLTVAAIIALAGGIALLWQDYQTWKRGGDSLIDWGKWQPGIDSAIAGLTHLKEALTGAFEAWEKFYKRTTKSDFKTDLKYGAQRLGDALGIKHGADFNGRDEKANAKEISKFFTDRGWSPAQAAGIAANLMSESGGRTRATGDKGTAFGLAQWHPKRQAEFKSRYGHDIQTATLQEQLDFVNFELTGGTEQGAGKALRGAKTAQEAGSIVSKQYERPKDTEGEASRRGTYAQSLLQGIPGASEQVAGANGAGKAQTVVNDRSIENHIGEVKVYTAATDANGIARDMGNSMDYLFTSQANAGLN